MNAAQATQIEQWFVLIAASRGGNDKGASVS
jgi:hypothetical protein